MAKVKVYNVNNDDFQISRRMATREGAKIMCGQAVEDTEREIDQSDLECGEQWTRRNYGLPRL